MLPSYTLLKQRLKAIIANKRQQGYDIRGIDREFSSLPNNYEELDCFAKKLNQLDYRDDWPYTEPDELEDIWQQCELADNKTQAHWLSAVPHDIEDRIAAAFQSSLCGCILGKPIEINPTLDMLKVAGEKIHEWPISNYISVDFLDQLGNRHDSWEETTRENIQYVAADDDINYTLIGMLVIEEHGLGFSTNDVRQKWLDLLPVSMTFGPERTLLAKSAIDAISENNPSEMQLKEWVQVWNAGDEYCGALIRMDAYGYACPGQPKLAAELAYKDASFTHRKTGLYSSMFIAAAISLAPVVEEPIEIFEFALKFVPKNSRFYEIVADSILQIRSSSDWMEAYTKIHGKYGEYCHCQIYQEIGTLINTIHFATDIGDAICKQVSQGNDTDSFGATCGSIAGLLMGPSKLDPKWLKPFDDKIVTSLSGFKDYSISSLTKRVKNLSALVKQEQKGQRVFERKQKIIIDIDRGI
ncbi:MAG: ADP-ribosylglycohydrolase family protein [Pseudomonadales bacterium]